MASPLREPPALHDKALQDLSFIRRTMEGASSFTDVPGWGLVVIGGTAVATSVLAASQPSAGRWIALWLAEAVLAASVGVAMMWRKMARRSGVSDRPLLSAPARKFLFGLVPAFAAGAVLTFALIDPRGLWEAGSDVPRALPGVWLLLYGVAVTTAGAYSVRAVPLMGLAFMLLGTLQLLLPDAPRDWSLALGFGVVQMGFGLWIARRHGG